MGKGKPVSSDEDTTSRGFPFRFPFQNASSNGGGGEGERKKNERRNGKNFLSNLKGKFVTQNISYYLRGQGGKIQRELNGNCGWKDHRGRGVGDRIHAFIRGGV